MRMLTILSKEKWSTSNRFYVHCIRRLFCMCWRQAAAHYSGSECASLSWLSACGVELFDSLSQHWFLSTAPESFPMFLICPSDNCHH